MRTDEEVMPMIAKDLMPWMFVKRTATWTPYVKIRSEQPMPEPALSSRPAKRRRRTPLG